MGIFEFYLFYLFLWPNKKNFPHRIVWKWVQINEGLVKIYQRHTVLSRNSVTKTNISQKNVFGGSTVLFFDFSQRGGIRTQQTLKKICIVFHLLQNVTQCLYQYGRLSSFSRLFRVWATQARVIAAMQYQRPTQQRDLFPLALQNHHIWLLVAKTAFLQQITPFLPSDWHHLGVQCMRMLTRRILKRKERNDES